MQYRTTLTCTLCLLVGAETSLSYSEQGKIKELLASWVGKDISKLSHYKQERFQSFVDKRLLLPKDTVNLFNSPASMFLNQGRAFVWKFEGGPKKSYLIFLNPHTGMIPSAEHAWLFIVNQDGKILNRSDFDTGWRMYADGASYSHVSWMSSPVLTQKMATGENGQGPYKIYFGFDGLQPAVIRIENEKSKSRKMDYFAPNWVVGPRFENKTKPAMRQVLSGTSEVRKLEALIWLAGNFGNPFDRFEKASPEAKREEALHSSLIRDKQIAQAVRQIRMNSKSYTRELANSVVLP